MISTVLDEDKSDEEEGGTRRKEGRGGRRDVQYRYCFLTYIYDLYHPPIQELLMEHFHAIKVVPFVHD